MELVCTTNGSPGLLLYPPTLSQPAKFAEPSPKSKVLFRVVTMPVLLMEKSVVVASAVEEAIKKSNPLVSRLLAEMASFAHGVEVPMPIAPLRTGA